MGTAPLVDCHTHTTFSDGASSFEENVRAAAAAGCRVLVSTDHLTLPASMDPKIEASVAEADLPAHRASYLAAVEIARQIAPELEFIYGFECDWYPGCEENVERWSQGAVVRLGSTHWIGMPGAISAGAAGAPGTQDVPEAGLPGSGAGWIDDRHDLHIWRELGPGGVRHAYVDAWCHACESPLDFDVMAHPDLAARFKNEGFPPVNSLEPLWDRMVTCARDTGRRIEVSTGGLRKTVNDYYPTRDLLVRFARAGVPITFGSDAHRAVDVCWGIREAQRYAYDCGYRTFDFPHADGSWETVELA